MTRLQLETGFIDLPIDIDFPIDLAFADIMSNGARSGGYSRTIDIDGTDNNTTLLGAYFDIDLQNEIFDRNVKTECSLIQNGVEVFTGFIQLLEIIRVNKTRSTNRKSIKYKIFIFDEVSNFFNEMGDKELTDLSFTELAHTFNRDTIVDSWSNEDGYIYPMFAKPDNIYTLRDFKPAIFEFEYFKKIFAHNGYTFTFAQRNDLDIRMDKRFIPFNGKQTEENIATSLQATYTVQGEMDSGAYDLNTTNLPVYPIGYLPNIDHINGNSINTYKNNAGTQIELDSLFMDTQGQWSLVNQDLTNLSGQGRDFNLLTSYDYRVQVRAKNSSGTVTAWQVQSLGGQSRCEVKVCLVAQSTTNVNKVALIDAQQTVIDLVGGETFTSGFNLIGNGNNTSSATIGTFDLNEKFDVHVLVFARYFNQSGQLVGNLPYWQSLANFYGDPFFMPFLPIRFTDGTNPVRLEFDIEVSDLQAKIVPNINDLFANASIDPTAFIPKKIKQRDLISTISKSYNLVFIPDQENPTNIIIKTRDKYYSDGAEWDWTDKLDESQPNSITFLSNDVKRRKVYKYKEDEDSLNTAYQSEIAETYGQTTLDLDNQYTQGTDEVELIYSPTPSVDTGFGKVLPSIDGVNPESNLRVLLNNGVEGGVWIEFYNDILPTAGTGVVINEYLKSSMFDNDQTPNFSVCFGSPKVLFHNQQTGQTNNYLYDLHHKQELTTINSGKKLTGFFDLSESDFQRLNKSLDFKIFIKDNGWFFISKVYGYNANKRTLTKVDLITADEKTRIKFRRQFVPVPLNDNTAVTNHFTNVSHNTNVFVGSPNAWVSGLYNYINGNNVHVTGNNNTVQANDVIVMGNNNKALFSGLRILGDNQQPATVSVVQTYKALLTQIGTDNPEVTVLENTLAPITWTRANIGVYRGTLSGLFPANKTFMQITSGANDSLCFIERISDSVIEVSTTTGLILSDDILNQTAVLIQIYN
jgi:hypothetical protein